MTKKQFTVFMAIMLTTLLCTGVWIYMAFNPPAKIGVVTVSSGKNSVVPLSNVLRYSTEARRETLRPLAPAEIEAGLPALVCDKGFVVDFTEQTLDDSFSFSLYNPDGSAVYTGRAGYEAPEAPGVYVVRFLFSWGNKEDNRIDTEQYLKVIYR